LRLTRQEAAALIPKLMTGYIDTLAEPNRGRPFWEVYDVETVQPTEEWLDIYYTVKEEISQLGLSFDYARRPKA
jgi:methylamine--corrinoid protein Co-methyltransferase